MSDAPETGELTAKVAGQELALKGVSINTIATVLTLIAVSLVGLLTWQHIAAASTRDASFTQALTEMVQAQREQNCLIAIPEAQREAKAEFCKRITR